MKMISYGKNKLHSIGEELKGYQRELGILFAAAFVVYEPFWGGQLNNADGFLYGVIRHGQKYGWEDAQGRFLLRWLDEWRDGFIIPPVIIGISIVLLLMSAVLIWHIFACEGRTERILIGAFVVFSPSVMNTFTYYYCADSYMLSYFLAVVAAALLILEGGG